MLSDFGALVRSGMAAVPDYGQQQVQQQELALRKQQMGQEREKIALATQKAQELLAERQRFQGRLTEVMARPTADGIGKLMMEFPEFSNELKNGWDAIDTDRRAADTRQLGAIATRLGGNDVAGASAELRRRIEADKAAGDDPSDDEQILAMLESGDPSAVKMAQTMIGVAIHAAVGPEKAKTFLESVLPKPDYEQNDGVVWDKNTGAILGQLPGQTVVIPDGGELRPWSAPGIPILGGGQQGGGDQASGGAGSADGSGAPRSVPKLAPLDLKGAEAVGGQFGTVTSTIRSPEKNRQVGGVKNSWHLKGRAIDIARKPGVSHAQVVEGYRRAGYQIIEQLDEGDHSHLAFAAGPSQTGGPVVVRSKQQFEKLASGTKFIAPDGSVRIKP